MTEQKIRKFNERNSLIRRTYFKEQLNFINEQYVNLRTRSSINEPLFIDEIKLYVGVNLTYKFIDVKSVLITFTVSFFSV